MSLSYFNGLEDYEVWLDPPLSARVDPGQNRRSILLDRHFPVRGGRLYVTNRDSNFITVISPRSPEILGTIDVGPGMGPIMLLPPAV